MNLDDKHTIDDLVRRAVGVDEQNVASVWSASEAKQALFQEITMTPQSTETHTSGEARRPRIRIVSFIATAVLAMTAVGVGASTLFTQTSFDDDALVRGRNIDSLIDEIGADVPLPPGGNFDGLREVAANGGSQTRAGLAGTLGFNAACQWYAHWYDAHITGRASVAAETVEVLRQMPTWTPIANTDEGANEVVPLLRGLADEAAQGNAQPVRVFLDINCGPESGWRS